MTSWPPIQYPANPGTGHNSGTGTPFTGQPLPTGPEPEDPEQQQTHLRRQQEVPDQQSATEPSATTRRAPFFASNLDANDTSALSNINFSGNAILIRTVYNLSLYDEPTFNLWQNLAHHGRPLARVYEDAPGLAEIDQSTWSALSALGGLGRPLFATQLRNRHLWLESTECGPTDLVGSSIAETLSPVSGTHSPSSLASTGSRDQPSSHPTFLCPDVDCKHKPEGFTKWGYLANHVGNRHDSIKDSGWEDRVQIRVSEELSPPRRRSDKQRKRPATPSTPGERAHKSVALLSGIGTSMPTDVHSQGMLQRTLASPSPGEQYNASGSALSTSNIPDLTLDGDPWGVQFPDPLLDFGNISFPNADTLQLPPSVTSRQRPNLPPAHWTGGPSTSRQRRSALPIDTSSSDSGRNDVAGVGRPSPYGDQSLSSLLGSESRRQQVGPPLEPPDFRNAL